MSESSLRASLNLIEIKPGKRFDLNTLRTLLPDVETTLFFGKVYDLNAQQLAALLHQVHNSDLTSALFNEGGTHSEMLQDYICGLDPDYVEAYEEGTIVSAPYVPHGEILPQVWEQLEVEVATSIMEVAQKLERVITHLPGKVGQMQFSHLRTLNAKRPTLGDFRAQVTHARAQLPNLVIFDDSGSVTAGTVKRIIADSVAMSYKADASFALVSNTCRFWEAGTYDVDTLLAKGEYGGTHYEKLAPLFDRDWGVVVCIADYDSSPMAKQTLASCKGRIEQVLDISLVRRPTFLSECVGQLAKDVKPILTGSSDYVLS